MTESERVDAVCAAIDAERLKIMRGQVGASEGLRAAVAASVMDSTLETPLILRRQAEVTFGYAAQLRADGDEDGGNRFEVLAINMMVDAARGGDGNALLALRTAGGWLCHWADEALIQSADIVTLAAVVPAGRA